jgi:hypothetical protein
LIKQSLFKNARIKANRHKLGWSPLAVDYFESITFAGQWKILKVRVLRRGLPNGGGASMIRQTLNG